MFLLKGDVVFAIPLGVDGDAHGKAFIGGAASPIAAKEGTRERGDLALSHGHLELALVGYDVVLVDGRDLEVDGTFLAVEKGIEVELFAAFGDFDFHGLTAVHTAKAGMGIECA